MSKYETVIGLEVHCQLATQTKIFCGCSTEVGAPPNTHTCPVCLGMPGVLPVMNERVVEYTLRLGRAVGCDIRQRSTFARKNYFYPDLPKGYQITQFDAPICEGGAVEIDVGETTKWIQLTRIHLEEDAGKLIHSGDDGTSQVDLNRTGTPLVEIVSEPELRGPDEAVAYLKELHNIVRYIGISDAHMERGNFRCDANISLRLLGAEELGTRVELKNLNSFNHVKRGIEYEVERHAALLDSGEAVVQETRLWDEGKQRTRSMRSKEEAHDYRYFPEPDLLPLVVPDAMLSAVELPELPRARRDRYEAELELSRYDADVLVAEKALSDYFEAVIATGAEAKTAANWITSELKGRLNADSKDIEDSPVSAGALGTILARLAEGRLSGKLAKQVFGKVYDGGEVERVLEETGEQLTDTSAIEAEVDKVVDANPSQVAAYRGGKTKMLGFFIGQVMKATGGKANPQAVREILLGKLEAPSE